MLVQLPKKPYTSRVGHPVLPITFDVTLLREPYKASGGMFGRYRWLRKRCSVVRRCPYRLSEINPVLLRSLIEKPDWQAIG